MLAPTIPKKQIYYGFECVNGQLKIKRHSSKTKNKLERCDSVNELFSEFFKHFKKMETDPISDKIVQKYALKADLREIDFINSVKKLYVEILQLHPEKLI